MTKGRKPIPQNLRVVRGTNKNNPGRENPNAPEPEGELGTPPSWLAKEAATVWVEDAPHWADEIDRRQFGLYCQAVADCQHFWAVCESEGWYYETDKGNMLRHPAAIQFESNRAFANKVAAEFGMNPTSRTRVKVPERRKPSPADRFRPKLQ